MRYLTAREQIDLLERRVARLEREAGLLDAFRGKAGKIMSALKPHLKNYDGDVWVEKGANDTLVVKWTDYMRGHELNQLLSAVHSELNRHLGRGFRFTQGKNSLQVQL